MATNAVFCGSIERLDIAPRKRKYTNRGYPRFLIGVEYEDVLGFVKLDASGSSTATRGTQACWLSRNGRRTVCRGGIRSRYHAGDCRPQWIVHRCPVQILS